MPPARRTRKRAVRTYGPGYRQFGELFFQMKRSYAGFSRQVDAMETITMDRLIRQLLR